MTNFIIRVVVNALLFVYLLPLVGGITFHGAMWPEGVVASVLFAGVSVIIGLGIGTLAVSSTLGAVLLLLFFWLIPAIQLEAMAHFFPQYLSITSWGTAIIGGLVFLGGNIVLHHLLKDFGVLRK